MADEKWIDGLKPEMPVHAAAKFALAHRLGIVRDRLPAAVHDADKDVEHVHQLRVGTRRAAAALRIFADCLPTRLLKTTRKTLRTLRRSAGAARDWDVFTEMVAPRLPRATTKLRPGFLFLFGFAQGQRERAQVELKEAHEAKADEFKSAIDDIAATLDDAKETGQTLRDLAKDTLTEMLHDLESAARADLENYEALHQVRILGKKLRYAMEIFVSCFDYEFRDRYYPAVEEMQDILGLANDSYTARTTLTQVREHLQGAQPKIGSTCLAGIESLIQFHETRLPKQRRKFEKWWRAWLKSGAEKAFAELIRGN